MQHRTHRNNTSHAGITPTPVGATRIDPTHVFHLKGTLKFYQPNLQGTDVADVVQLYRPQIRLTDGQYTLARFVRIGDNVGLMQVHHLYEVELYLLPANMPPPHKPVSIDTLLPAGGLLQIHRGADKLLGEGTIEWVTTTPNLYVTQPPPEVDLSEVGYFRYKREYKRQLERQKRLARQQRWRYRRSQHGGHQPTQSELLNEQLVTQLRLHLFNKLQQLCERKLQEFLVQACKDGDTLAAWLALQAGAKPQSLRKGKPSPLMDAASEGNIQLVAILLHYGAQVNYRDNYFEHSALHYAVEHGDKPMMRLLLDYGAQDHFYRDKDRLTYGLREEYAEPILVASRLNDAPSRAPFTFEDALAIALGVLMIITYAFVYFTSDYPLS